MNKNIDLGLLLIRLSAGGLMLFHGVAKMINGIAQMAESMGTFAYAVYLGEVIAPIAILLGFRTRIASLLLAITCIVATFVAHADQLFSVSEHGGGYGNELLTFYFLASLALFFTGAGKYAISSKNKWD